MKCQTKEHQFSPTCNGSSSTSTLCILPSAVLSVVFFYPIICSCFGPAVLKSEKSFSPCSALSLSATSPASALPSPPAVYYLSAMSNAVQREAGGGSDLSQPRDSSRGQRVEELGAPPHPSFTDFSFHRKNSPLLSYVPPLAIFQ